MTSINRMEMAANDMEAAALNGWSKEIILNAAVTTISMGFEVDYLEFLANMLMEDMEAQAIRLHKDGLHYGNLLPEEVNTALAEVQLFISYDEPLLALEAIDAFWLLQQANWSCPPAPWGADD